MNDQAEGCMAACFMCLAFMVLAGFAVHKVNDRGWQTECVSRDVAEWKTDSAGYSTFHWKVEPKPVSQAPTEATP
jgi:hypothetical protein